MKKRLKISISLLVFTLGLFFLQGCKDIVATNIEGNTPALIAPLAMDTVANNPVYFKWEEMEGATKYRIQIASPGFSNISAYILDSIVTGTDFLFELDSSEYELKLTAMNAGYTSKTLGPIKFWVATSGNNTNTDELTIDNPEDSLYVNDNFDGLFEWNVLTGAVNYEFELRKGVSFSSGQLIYAMTPGNTLSETLPSSVLPLAPGIYKWRIIANDANGNILASKIVTLFVDTSVPGKPTLTLPTIGSQITVADSVEFKWNMGSNTGSYQSPVKSFLEVSDAQSFSTILHQIGNISGASKKILFTNLTNGASYYWRVYHKDDAGNQSNYSDTLSFIAN